MIERILVAVDDSAPALGAAAFAMEMATQVAAELRFVTVSSDGDDPEVMLRHVDATAEQAGISASTDVIATTGQPFEAILDLAVLWEADVIVMGRSDRRATGRPYVGSQTEHLLEFTPIPVVVVPGV
jgi:nucleotide-binding universal stress UspA family protein